MQPKKPETRAKHDRYRCEHINKIYAMYEIANRLTIGSDEWIKIMAKINYYEQQLRIYDKIMNYEN